MRRPSLSKKNWAISDETMIFDGCKNHQPDIYACVIFKINDGPFDKDLAIQSIVIREGVIYKI